MTGDDDIPVRIHFWRRWLHAISGVFADEVRQATVIEIEQRHVIAERDRTIAELRTLIEERDAALELTRSDAQVQAREAQRKIQEAESEVAVSRKGAEIMSATMNKILEQQRADALAHKMRFPQGHQG